MGDALARREGTGGACRDLGRQLRLDPLVGVHGLAVHDKPIVEVLGDQVDYHGTEQDDILVQSKGNERIDPPGGKRCEYRIVDGNQQHGPGDIACRLECELPVDGEIVDDRGNQGDEITPSVRQLDQFEEQREGEHLDYAGTGGEQYKLEHLHDVLFSCQFQYLQHAHTMQAS